MPMLSEPKASSTVFADNDDGCVRGICRAPATETCDATNNDTILVIASRMFLALTTVCECGNRVNLSSEH